MVAPLDLDAIQARLDAATPGPWRRQGQVGVVGQQPKAWVSGSYDGGRHEPRKITDYIGGADADLIAHAPADIAALLNRVRLLQEKVEWYERLRRIDDGALREIASARRSLLGEVQELRKRKDNPHWKIIAKKYQTENAELRRALASSPADPVITDGESPECQGPEGACGVRHAGWEYRTLPLGGGRMFTAQELDLYGAQGWELVSIDGPRWRPGNPSGHEDWMYVFKRPISGPDS